MTWFWYLFLHWKVQNNVKFSSFLTSWDCVTGNQN